MQHIGLQRENENGDVLATYEPDDGISLEIVKNASPNSVCLRFIDPYGDVVFNQVQLPVLIHELRDMIDHAQDASLKQRLGSVVEFLVASRDIHVYVRFVGD
jgi:hypothetical protein